MPEFILLDERYGLKPVPYDPRPPTRTLQTDPTKKKGSPPKRTALLFQKHFFAQPSIAYERSPKEGLAVIARDARLMALPAHDAPGPPSFQAARIRR